LIDIGSEDREVFSKSGITRKGFEKERKNIFKNAVVVLWQCNFGREEEIEEVVLVVQLLNVVCCRDVNFDVVWCC